MSTKKQPSRTLSPTRGLKNRKAREALFNDEEELEQDDFKEPETWTVITALSRILEEAEDSKLSDAFWKSVESPLAFLRDKLGLTNIQLVVLAIMVEKGDALAWKSIANYLDCSRLSLMAYSDEIEELVKKRWIVHRGVHEFGSFFQGFRLVFGVVKALRNNEPFIPEKLDELNEQQFVDKLESHLDKNIGDRNAEYCDDEEWMLELVNSNPSLPLCREVLSYDDIHVQSLLLLAVFDYAQWADSDGEGLTMSEISDLYPEEYECDGMRFKLRHGNHPLMKKGLIELKCMDGQSDNEHYTLTQKAKNELLAEYEPSRTRSGQRNNSGRALKKHTNIKEKTLFFNDSEQQQIDRLAKLLSIDYLPSVQKRLEEQGMRKGFACLFYGAPGTGKTETVLQIARQTGRDLMQVDIAGLRDKFVGESEKNIKEVFARYRALCRNSEVMPILFFNEADAIINKRSENIEHSVDKMDNAMQNIILQEIEDLEGILIATTNLTSNLDRAFERRFIYKIEFHKPDTDVKTKIWQSMLKDLSPEDARQLALHFDFSGGQIENVARKRTVDYILSGKVAPLHEIEDYCRSELLANKNERKHISGFA